MIIKDDPSSFVNYTYDASNYKAIPQRVILIEDIADFDDVKKEFQNSNVPIAIRGMGTGLTGGCVVDNGIVISLELFNKIEFINGKIKAQAGATNKDIQKIANQNGYFLPPDPTETSSSIGGNIANNSSGARSYRYGAIRNYVSSLVLLLPNGNICTLKRGENLAVGNELNVNLSGINFSIPIVETIKEGLKNSSGYYLKSGMDLIDLFIGSEGTLGIILEATLELVKLPVSKVSLLNFFDDLAKCKEFVNDLRSHSTFKPILIEYLDSNSIQIAHHKYNEVPHIAKAAIWCEFYFDSEHESQALLEQWLEFLANYTSLSDETIYAGDDIGRQHIANIRHSIPLEVNELIFSKGYRKIGTDMAVPKSKFDEYFDYMHSILENSGLKFLIFGHIGDCHLHANLLPANEIEFNKAIAIYNEMLEKAVNMGGTVSAEHGIGKLKSKYIEMMYNIEILEIFKIIKMNFDPNNIFGRDNIFSINQI